MDELLDVTATLMGPNGCPWDAKQTFYSLQKHFLEEVHEVIDAIDEKDPDHIVEELGDVFYVVLFAAKIGAKEGLFTIEEILTKQKEKLIRRHPHVFSETKQNLSLEELQDRWEEIKKKEKKDKPVKSFFQNIPQDLPLLFRSQKILQKLERCKDFPLKEVISSLESSFQKNFFLLLYKEVLDVEGEVRRGIKALEKAYEKFEKKLPEKA